MHPPTETNIKYKVLVVLAVAAAALPLLAMCVLPWIPIYVGVLLSAAVGGPLIVWSSRYENPGQASLAREAAISKTFQPTAKPFLPSAADFTTGLAWIACFTLMALPFLAVVLGLLLIPAGDSWPMVIVRVLFLAVAILMALAWWRLLAKHFMRRVQRILPLADLQAVDQYLNAPKLAPKRNECIKDSLVWLTVSVFAFVLVTDIININNFRMQNAPRRLRGAAAMIDWCCGNPNFTKGSLTITMCVGLVMSASQARAATKGKDA